MRPALNARQRAFVTEYLVDLNAASAAMRAGYSARSAPSYGTWLLRHPPVRAAVNAAMMQRAERIGVARERVLLEIARVAFADIRKALRIEPREPGEGIDDDTAAAIGDLSRTAGGAMRVRLHDKMAALNLLARHLGLFDTQERWKAERQVVILPDNGRDKLPGGE